MQAENLTPSNVVELEEKLKAMQKENTELTYRFHAITTEVERMNKVLARVDGIEAKLKHIFGGHVLINGQFVKV